MKRFLQSIGIVIATLLLTAGIVNASTILFPTGGGTGWGSPGGLKAHTVILGNDLNSVSTTSPSNAGYVLTSNGTNADPTFQAATGGSGGSGNVSTSTHETAGQLSYWTSNSGTPALLGQVATTTLTASGPLSLSNPISVIGASASALTCTTASSGIGGCLSNTAFDTFNNKQATISATWPVILTGATVSFGGLSTTSQAVVGNIPYFSGVNTFANVATSTIGAGTGISFSGTSGYQVGGTNGTFSVNTSQNISTLSNLSSAGTLNNTSGGVLYSTATSTPTVSAPITYSGTLGQFIGGASGAFGCTTASSGVTGCLSGTDWNTFNGKGSGSVTSVATNNGLTGGTITTTGTIGLATINANSVLGNITGASGVPTSLATSSLFQNASASFSGLLTSTDWSTFNNKLSGNQTVTLTGNVTGSGATSISTTIAAGVVTNAMLAGSIDLTSKVTGTLPILNGGTNATSYATNVLMGYNGTSFIATGTPQLTVGNILATTTTATSTFSGVLVVATTSPQAFVVQDQFGTGDFQVSTASTTGPILTVQATSTTALFFGIDQYAHRLTGGTAPTCGTGCSTVVGDDSNMRMVTGTTITTATINFANTWKNTSGTSITPVCDSNEESAGSVSADASSTPTTVVLTFASALTAKYIAVHCEASNNFTY